jgi:hypothetical protein
VSAEIELRRQLFASPQVLCDGSEHDLNKKGFAHVN